MLTPIEILKEHRKGIDQVLLFDLTNKERAIVRRKNLEFTSAINLLDNMAQVRDSVRRQRVTMSRTRGEVKNGTLIINK